MAIGLFGQPENVQRALDKLRHAGLPVHSDVLQTPKGELTRIWVGPYDSSTQAQEQAAQVDKLGLPATVMKR